MILMADKYIGGLACTLRDSAKNGLHSEGMRELLQDAAAAIDAAPVENADRTQMSWIVEREATIAMLRRVCADHGDNDWEPTLHLADIIDKHLARHIDRGRRTQ